MVAPDSLTDSSAERNATKGCDVTNGTGQSTTTTDVVSNGNDNNKTAIDVGDTVGTKQPSYVALACCISGYTTLSYDSKTRQGLRSLSPIRPSESAVNHNAPNYTSDCGNYLSPLARDLSPKMQTQDKGVEYLNGCGGLHSPRHVSNLSISKESRSYTSKSMFVSESFSSYSSQVSSTCYSSTTSHSSTLTNTTTINGNESRLITPTKVGSSNVGGGTSPSSFIMQRVERLYGPGALAQGFYTRRIKTTTDQTKESKWRGTEREMDKRDDSSPLPVLKLLRPEFRAQLTVANRKSKFIPTQESTDYQRGESVDEVDRVSCQTEQKVEESSRDSCGKEEVKDGHYFLKRLQEEVSRLESLAAKAETELETCQSEEGAGVLRAVAGKARLLVAQKLHQFRGLCTNNIKQSTSEDFPTTNEDLAGFWDMVMIQVRQILSQFEQLDTLREHNWIAPENPIQKNGNANEMPALTASHSSSNNVMSTKKSASAGSRLNGVGRTSGSSKGGSGIGKKIGGAGTGGGEASKARDEARRRLIEEKRRAMREAKAKEESVTNGATSSGILIL